MRSPAGHWRRFQEMKNVFFTVVICRTDYTFIQATYVHCILPEECFTFQPSLNASSAFGVLSVFALIARMFTENLSMEAET